MVLRKVLALPQRQSYICLHCLPKFSPRTSRPSVVPTSRDTTSLSTRSCYIYLEHLTSKFPIPTLNLNAPPHRFHRKNCKPCHHASKPKTKPHLSYPTPKCLSQQSGMHNYAVSGLSTTSYHCAHTEVVIRSRHARGCHPSPPATQAFNSRNA